MLLGAVGQAGCAPIDLGLVRDDEAALEAVLADAAARCDAVVTSGGVSMGDFDIVKAVLGRLATMRWMQIAIRPAKPFAFGLLSGPERPVPVFGLPGNPVSSLVSFELIARPALRQMMGHQQLDRPRVRAVADEGFRRRPDGKTHWTRVIGRFEDDGRLHVRSTGGQGSHQLASTAAANGLAEVRDGDGVAPGGDVDVLLLVRPTGVSRRGLGRRMRAMDLVDPHGRTVRDLRISVTDRCNFRCTYCMPEEGMQWLPRDQILSFEEIERLARLCVERFGVDGIRLTGGEPTVRAHLPVLVEKLSRLRVPSDAGSPHAGRKPDLSITTNGATFRLLAHELRQAGLDRVNISLRHPRPGPVRRDDPAGRAPPRCWTASPPRRRPASPR